MPDASGRLLAQLQVNPDANTSKDFWMAGEGVDGVWFELSAGHQLGSPGLLFQKIEDDVIEVQISKLLAAGAANAAAVLAESASKSNNSGIENDKNMNAAMEAVAETKPEVTYDDFAKLDLRVATVVACEKVEKADKLLKLTLEVGTETRTVVSGIALHFSPEEVVGKQVLLLANLAPRKMRGIESQGMILMAEDADGKLVFMSPSNAVASGSGVS